MGSSVSPNRRPLPNGASQEIAEDLPLVTFVEPRCSIKLKVKGKHGDSSDYGSGRTSLNSGTYPLFDNFLLLT
jgi:hypothetical protein